MSTLKTAELVGKGRTSDVYAWREGLVLKLFHPQFSDSRVEREFSVTRAVHAAGIPAPAVHEVVEVEGRRGIIFEHVHGPSLLDCVQAKPWTLFAAAKRLGELHAQLHSFKAPAELPSQRRQLASGIEAVKGVPDAEKHAALHRLSYLPDGDALCHGDFHPENILLSERGPVIIDWYTGARGHPLGDVARTSYLFRHAGPPPSALRKVLRSLLHETYLRRYLQLNPGTRDQIEAWAVPLAIAAAAWRVQTPAS